MVKSTLIARIDGMCSYTLYSVLSKRCLGLMLAASVDDETVCPIKSCSGSQIIRLTATSQKLSFQIQRQKQR